MNITPLVKFKRLPDAEKHVPGMIIYGAVVNDRSCVVSLNSKHPSIGWLASYQDHHQKTVHIGHFATRKKAEKALLQTPSPSAVH